MTHLRVTVVLAAALLAALPRGTRANVDPASAERCSTAIDAQKWIWQQFDEPSAEMGRAIQSYFQTVRPRRRRSRPTRQEAEAGRRGSNAACMHRE